METNAVFVIEQGTVTAMAGGPLSIADMGPRTTKRASHLEFNAAENRWEVLTTETRFVMYSHADYDVALAWEIAEFNRRLAVCPNDEDYFVPASEMMKLNRFLAT